jgi:hypothetical protein
VRKYNGGFQGLGGGEHGQPLFNGFRIPVWNDEKLLVVDSDAVAQQYDCA